MIELTRCGPAQLIALLAGSTDAVCLTDTVLEAASADAVCFTATVLETVSSSTTAAPSTTLGPKLGRTSSYDDQS